MPVSSLGGGSFLGRWLLCVFCIHGAFGSRLCCSELRGSYDTRSGVLPLQWHWAWRRYSGWQ